MVGLASMCEEEEYGKSCGRLQGAETNFQHLVQGNPLRQRMLNRIDRGHVSGLQGSLEKDKKGRRHCSEPRLPVLQKEGPQCAI